MTMSKVHVFVCLVGLLSCTSALTPSITVLNVTDTQMNIEWTPLGLGPHAATEYNLKLDPISYQTAIKPQSLEFKFAGTTKNAQLFGLNPSTEYNITLEGFKANGTSESAHTTAWTIVGEPDAPPKPVGKRDDKSTWMTIEIEPFFNSKGPITAVRIIVFERSSVMEFDHEKLVDYDTAQDEGMPFYLAAELFDTAKWFNRTFTVGDGRTYGTYRNAPLDSKEQYDIILGVVSTLNNITKYAYSVERSRNFDTVTSPFDIESNRKDAALIFLLSVAIGIVGFLLLASVIIYMLVRRYYGHKKQHDRMVLCVRDLENMGNNIALDLDRNSLAPGQVPRPNPEPRNHVRN